MALRFGTDGLRGVANVELTPELALAVGRAAARVLGRERPFVVGRDTRRSGPLLEAALCAGLAAEGAGALLAGVVPTPAVAHLAKLRGSPGAVVSASHNPFGDNGIKLFASGGRKLSDDDQARLEKELDRPAEGEPPRSGAALGSVEPFPEALPTYVAHLVASLEGRRLDGLSVVLDCANGAAWASAPEALRRLGVTVDLRAARPSGTNINAGCGSTDTAALRRAVPAVSAHAGLALDGDADRLLAVDERGELVDGDHILAIAALDLADRGLLPGRTVVATVMSNLGLRRALEGHDIHLVETAVGDRAVVEAMEAEGLALGGEQSGHVVFAGRATTGDGTLTAILLLDVMARTGRPLSELASVVRKLPQVLRGLRTDGDSGRLSGDLAEETAWGEARLAGRGRVLVRASGTEPLVRVMVEAEEEALAVDVADQLVGRLERRLRGEAP